MKTDRFEYEFGEFIDGQKYEEAETALFELARIAFSAGWEAAKKEQSEAKVPILIEIRMGTFVLYKATTGYASG